MPRILSPGVWAAISAGCTGALGVTGSVLWESGNYSNLITKVASSNYVFGYADSSSPYNSIVTIDVSNKASPSVAYSSGNLGWSASALDRFIGWSSFTNGNWLYVFGTRSYLRVHVLDISDPESPVDTYEWNLGTSFDPYRVRLPHWTSGGNDYTAIQTGNAPGIIHIIQFSPSSGTDVGSVNVPNSDFWVDMAYENNKVYGARNEPGTIDVCNVSTPSSPSITSYSGILDADFVDCVAIRDSVLYVAYANSTSGLYELASIDVSSTPTLLDSVALNDEAFLIDSCSGHVIVGLYNDKLQSINISNPSSLSVTDTETLPAGFSAAFPSNTGSPAIFVESDYLYLTGNDAGSSNRPKLLISTS